MAIAKATLDILKNPAHRRVWIIGQLRLKGTSLRQLSIKEGVSHQALSNALMVPSRHLEQTIADALEMRIEDLFPERFDEGGRRLHRERDVQRSTGGAAAHGKRRRAA